MLMTLPLQYLYLHPCLPIISEVGIDPVHFGVIMVVNLAIGFVTPPIKSTFCCKHHIRHPGYQIAARVIPLIGFFPWHVLISIFPQISLMLL